MMLFDFAAWLPFVLTCVIIELTPGPNMAYLALLSASHGRRPGFAATAGVALGLLLVGLAAALGLATLIASAPVLYHLLRIGGVFYLLWLAWESWRETGAPDLKDERARFFRRGLVTNLLNPKAALFYVGILPAFLTPAPDVYKQAILLTVVYVSIATLIHACVVTLAGSAHAFLQDGKRRRIVCRAFAGALVLIALWFAWSSA